MKKLILYHKGDAAAVNIMEKLKRFLEEDRKLEERVKIISSDSSILYLDENPKLIEEIKTKNYEICIVPSKHKSKAGMKTLSCHPPGNFSIAEYGGSDKTLGVVNSIYLTEALLMLKKYNSQADYDVCFECTHHGPTSLEIPVIFIEIGSSEAEWKNDIAANTVARVIKGLLDMKTLQKDERISCIGFGGGHYCRKFSKIIESEKFALGHICPKYHLKNLNHELIKQMVEKTLPKPKIALLDKKGLGSEKRRILELLENFDLESIML
ncbi:MAG TPA: hypothetical protein ENG50_02930 [Candidatus Altiarchaeales archaeon]|nr:hypothetical protein [Candidatus Altiarchaeales archaeon]